MGGLPGNIVLCGECGRRSDEGEKGKGLHGAVLLILLRVVTEMGILLRMIETTDAFKSNQSIDFDPARTKADLPWKTTTDFSFLDS